jgi:hypothetical protein
VSGEKQTFYNADFVINEAGALDDETSDINRFPISSPIDIIHPLPHSVRFPSW